MATKKTETERPTVFLSMSGGVLNIEALPEGVDVVVTEHDNGEKFIAKRQGRKTVYETIQTFEPKR